MSNIHQITHCGELERKHQSRQITEENYLELKPYQIEDDSFQYKFENSAKITQEQLRLPNKINPEETEHFKIYENVIKILDQCGSICGFRVTFRWKSFREFFFDLCCFFVALMWVSSIYTHIRHYRNGDYIRVLEPIASFGYVVSMTLKMTRHWERYKQMFAIIFSTRKINRSNLTGGRADILKKCNIQTLRITKIYFAVTAFAFFSFSLPGLYLYYVKHARVNLLPVSFPFFDDTTVSGFVQTNVLQSVIGMFSVTGTAFHGAIFIVMISNYILRVELIEQDIKDLDEMWTTENKISVSFKRRFILNVIKKKQDLTKYMEITNEIYQTRLSIYFFFSYFSLIVCLFEIKKFDYMPGFGMAMSLFLEMTFYCSMGTKITIASDKVVKTAANRSHCIEIFAEYKVVRCEPQITHTINRIMKVKRNRQKQNEKLVACIYDSQWYQYDLQSQRMIIMLLHNCQQAKEIQLGPIGPLNVMTLISIVKSIYTYYTVLMDLF